jgi:hypothetical protein
MRIHNQKLFQLASVLPLFIIMGRKTSTEAPVSVPVNPAGDTPDDLIEDFAETKGLAHRHWIASEACRPIVVRNYGDRMGARFIVITRGEKPSERGFQSEDREHVPGNELSEGFLYLVIGAVGQICALRVGNRDQFRLILNRPFHLFKGRVGIAVVGEKTAINDVDAAECHREKALGLRYRQGPKKQGIDQPESGDASSGGKCQRENSRCRYDFRLYEPTQRVDRIGTKGCKKCHHCIHRNLESALS